MIFEDILAEVGDFGPFQRILLAFFVAPTSIVLPLFGANYLFMFSAPDHICLNNALSNLTQQQRNMLPHPTEVMYGVEKPSQCSSYMFNYTEALFILDAMKTNNNLIHEISKEWKPKPCVHGWEYDKTWYIETAVTKWNLVCDQDYLPSLVMTLIMCGGAAGSAVFGDLSDRYGRRPTLFIALGVMIVSGTASVAVPDFTAFAILKPFTEISIMALFQVPFILVAELVPSDKRTLVLMVSSFAWVTGLCILPLVAYLTQHWLILGAVSTVVVLPFIGYWWLVPESPRWLLSQKRYEEAEEVFKTVARRNNRPVPKDLKKNIKQIAEMEEESRNKEKASSLDFIRVSVLRKFFLVLNIAWVACGISYYGLQLNIVNLGGNEFLNFFLLGVAEFPSYMACWYSMDNFGRRWTTVGLLIMTALSAFCAAAIPLENHVIDVAMSMIGKFANAAGYIAIYQQACELFPTPLRNGGIGISSSISMFVLVTVPYIIYIGLYNRRIPFIIIGSFSLVGAFSAMFLPETLGINLPQTVADCEEINANHKFFSWIRKSTLEKQRKRDTLLKKATPKMETSVC